MELGNRRVSVGVRWCEKVIGGLKMEGDMSQSLEAGIGKEIASL